MSAGADFVHLAAWCDEHDCVLKVERNDGESSPRWSVRVWNYGVSAVALGLGEAATFDDAVARCLDEHEFTPALREVVR